MYVIKPETRYAWKHQLTDGYGFDPEMAQSIVDYVAGDPAVADSVPKTGGELDDAIFAVEGALDEFPLGELGGAERHEDVRSALMDTIERSLGLDTTGAVSASDSSGSTDMTVAKEDMSPPEYLERDVEEWTALIEDDEEAWEFDDLLELVEWVEYRLDEEQ
ncbi:hypothetical protein [Haloarcula sediminis]|uniref:hypothetical protein n=1 Tax=Haloarcula sediminis TaxID=3111777 RepID=UPI002D78B25D|nr:hypothetical protein [Haloarcula sp. CK38]